MLGLVLALCYLKATQPKHTPLNADTELALIWGCIGALVGAKLLYLATVLPDFLHDLPLLRQAGLTLVDLRAMRMDTEPFHKYPSCQEGFLILENGGEKNYLEINHFIKAFLERMLNQWITKKQQQR